MNRFLSLASILLCIPVLSKANDDFLSLLAERGMDWSPVTNVSHGGAEVIPIGSNFVSPDKRFSVQLVKADRDYYFEIKEAKTGITNRLFTEYAPVFSLDWSPDSQSIVAIVHASETSLIELIHWSGQRWNQFAIDIPNGGRDDKFHVVKWEPQGKAIKATYIVDHKYVNKSIRLYRCIFNIDPVTGKTSSVQETPLTLAEFRALRTISN